MPSSSSGDGDGNRHDLTIMTDSNVLRLIRRYDPVGSSTTGIRTRHSLEHTRGAWQTIAPKSLSSLPYNVPSTSCSYLPQQSVSFTHENNESVKQPSTPRLQRQKAIHEQEPSSFNVTNSIRPILKYTPSAARAELNVQPKKTEPLSIEIVPHVSPPSIITNEHPVTYQPLITTGTKRVCAAISKSEWDLRSQHDLPSPVVPPPSSFPVRPSSPHRPTVNLQQQKESYRPLLGRSKSTIAINNNHEDDDDIDDFDEKSAPIITTGSCVDKLKKLFITKSSLDLTNSPIDNQHRVDSIESNLNRRLNDNNKTSTLSSPSSCIQNIPKSNSIESQSRTITNGSSTKPITVIQEAVPTSSPLIKKPLLRSQKTFDRYVKKRVLCSFGSSINPSINR
jgi:hypothetical protein